MEIEGVQRPAFMYYLFCTTVPTAEVRCQPFGEHQLVSTSGIFSGLTNIMIWSLKY